MSDLQPYYLNEGKRLLDTLLSIGLVGVDTENDYNAISEFLGEELQAIADTGMRRATMKLRREQLLAERQEQDAKVYSATATLQGTMTNWQDMERMPIGKVSIVLLNHVEGE